MVILVGSVWSEVFVFEFDFCLNEIDRVWTMKGLFFSIHEIHVWYWIYLRQNHFVEWKPSMAHLDSAFERERIWISKFSLNELNKVWSSC